jgi:hypothetical protein
MTFGRRRLICLCAAFLFAGSMGLVPHRAAAQPATQPAATAQPAPASPQNAYSLPPGKLAKAIALNRIRNIMDIVSGLWGLAVLWLLLATRAAAGLAAWAERVLKRRWLQGLLFFAVLIVILTLANLPLDLFNHLVSRSYGISVQGWASWTGDEAKALGLSVLLTAPILLLFNWIVRRWPRRYWLGVWVATLPLLVLSIPSSTSSSRWRKIMPRWSRSSKKLLPAPELRSRPTACS